MADLASAQYGRQNLRRRFTNFVYQFGVRYNDQPTKYSRNFEQAMWPLLDKG
jgi:hypothetical protein